MSVEAEWIIEVWSSQRGIDLPETSKTARSQVEQYQLAVPCLLESMALFAGQADWVHLYPVAQMENLGAWIVLP